MLAERRDGKPSREHPCFSDQLPDAGAGKGFHTIVCDQLEKAKVGIWLVTGIKLFFKYFMDIFEYLMEQCHLFSMSICKRM